LFVLEGYNNKQPDAMKKNMMITGLLLVFSMGNLFAQTGMMPAGLVDDKTESGSIIPINPAFPEHTTIVLNDVPDSDGKLSVVISPNPFSNHTSFICHLPAKGKLTLKIYNMFGESMMSFEDIIEEEGSHSIEMNSATFHPGIYTAMLVFKTRDNVVMRAVRMVCNQ
jgi:hypothetical protein